MWFTFFFFEGALGSRTKFSCHWHWHPAQQLAACKFWKRSVVKGRILNEYWKVQTSGIMTKAAAALALTHGSGGLSWKCGLPCSSARFWDEMGTSVLERSLIVQNMEKQNRIKDKQTFVYQWWDACPTTHLSCDLPGYLMCLIYLT